MIKTDTKEMEQGQHEVMPAILATWEAEIGRIMV
jgi:hypothetical protein